MFSPVLTKAKRVSRDWVNKSGVCFCATREKFEHLRKTRENKLATCRLAPKTSMTATSKVCTCSQPSSVSPMLGTVLSIIFTTACHILSHVLSTLPVIQCRSSSTISPLSQPKSNGMQIDLVRAADDSQTQSEKVESMICIVVSSIGEDKEEPMDLLKARPNLVA